jgi:hypothetical protein
MKKSLGGDKVQNERNKLAVAAAMLEEYETLDNAGSVRQARKIIEEILEM